jgi:16S rRNA (guanine966-N2)-methyltransferase
VRAAILNSLQSHLTDSCVLDLFAGTGAFGLEALSRGARSCDFVERDERVFAILKQNLQELLRRAKQAALDLDACQLHKSEVDIFLDRQNSKKNYDIIWADPPYDLASAWYLKCFSMLREMLHQGNVLIIECHTNDAPQLSDIAEASGLLVDIRKYGITGIVRIQQK